MSPQPRSDTQRSAMQALSPRWVLVTSLWMTFLIPGVMAVTAQDSDPESKSATPDTSQDTSTSAPAPAQDKDYIIYERVMVVGSAESSTAIPGSAHYIDRKELEKQADSDIHRVLRSVPGVNIQEEDGHGLRPNIGMRGTGVERSQKITLMEDGILIAPAPYTAPAAYYFPTTGRMEGIEVRKGSSSVKQGPYTNGGALNLISSSIPGSLGVRANLALGEDDTRRLHGLLGDTRERFGWLLETYQLETDGFKRLDNGGPTGVDLGDYVGKFRVNSAAQSRVQQSLELKLGKTDQFGQETYLGLTDADFVRQPFRRYAASQNDTIDTDHEQAQLRYFVQPRSNLDWTTTVYSNDFFRNWYKNEAVLGTSNRSVLDDPELFSTEIAILRGEADSQPGALTLRNNRRNYYSRGVQSVLGFALNGTSVSQQFELGVRFHEDEEDRFQEDDLYQMLGGSLILTERGDPGSQTNRVSDARAMAFFVQDQISLGRLTLTPGLRYESIDYRRHDFRTDDPNRDLGPSRVRSNGVDVVIPGIGVAYQLGAKEYLVGGAHKGFSPPGAGSNTDTREEESWNYEVGYRRRGARLGAELLFFYSDYDNLLGAETVSGGGTSVGDLFNGGAVVVEGIEAGLNYELRPDPVGFSIPLRLTYTYTSAEFQSSFDTGFADWRPRVERGDELPYLPEHQVTGTIGLVGRQWGLHLRGDYTSTMRTTAGQGPIPHNEGTDSRLVVDVSGEYQLYRSLKLIAQLRNATDEVYRVARRPYGIRPGLSRTFLAGVSFEF